MSGEFHCHVTAGKPKHAASHAMYILRLGKYSGCDKFEDLVHDESGNMPKWAAHDPIIFWECADEFERKNGTPYSEIEFSLPNELSDEQCIELLQDYVRREFGTKHAYTFAFHSKISELSGVRHKHAHVVYSERVIDGVERGPEQYFGRAAKLGSDPAKGGCRKLRANMNRTEKSAFVEQQRERCCAVLNEYLERFNQDHTYDHRSFKRQGRTDRIAQDRVSVGDLKRMPKEKREKLLRDRQAAVELELAAIELSQAEAELDALGIDIDASLADAKSKASGLMRGPVSVRPVVRQQPDAVAVVAPPEAIDETPAAVVTVAQRRAELMAEYRTLMTAGIAGTAERRRDVVAEIKALHGLSEDAPAPVFVFVPEPPPEDDLDDPDGDGDKWDVPK